MNYLVDKSKIWEWTADQHFKGFGALTIFLYLFRRKMEEIWEVPSSFHLF